MQLAVEIIIHHFAILNADDPFRLRRNPIIMCNENHGAALLAELMQDAHDLLAGMGIKVAGRLVGQNDRGTGCHRACDRHALLLAPGHF